MRPAGAISGAAAHAPSWLPLCTETEPAETVRLVEAGELPYCCPPCRLGAWGASRGAWPRKRARCCCRCCLFADARRLGSALPSIRNRNRVPAPSDGAGAPRCVPKGVRRSPRCALGSGVAWQEGMAHAAGGQTVLEPDSRSLTVQAKSTSPGAGSMTRSQSLRPSAPESQSRRCGCLPHPGSGTRGHAG